MDFLDENLVAELARRNITADTFRRLPPDKKRLIYRTAIRLFGKYGYDGLPVGRVCREAGISKGSFFQYFATKSHLLEFCLLIFNDRLARLLERIRREDQGGLFQNRLFFVYQSFASSDLSADERQFYLFASGGLRHSGVLIKGFDLEQHLADYIADLVSRGVETNELRGDIDPTITASFLSACFSALIIRQFIGAEPEPETIENFSSLIFDGIKA